LRFREQSPLRAHLTAESPPFLCNRFPIHERA
jgi:hypothetical protein